MSPLRARGRAVAALLAAAAAASVGSAAAGGTASIPPVPEPVLGQQETLTPIAGAVAVRIRGARRFERLRAARSVPDGSEVDTRRGRVQIAVASAVAGQSDTALAYGGRFLLHQDGTPTATAHLDLSQPLGGCGPAQRARASGWEPTAGAARRGASRSRHLWTSDNGGSWGTGGKYVSTTVEGTSWLTIDECHRSRVRVAEGVVLVRDLVHHVSVKVSAGHEYSVTRAPQEGRALVPPSGQVFTGVSGGSVAAFQRQVGKHPAVLGYFANWNESIATALAQARAARARLLLHISTDVGYGSGAGESISPGGIASGGDDGYLVRLGEELARSGRPAYVALLPEMNQANNAYSAFDTSGAARGGSHSTADYRQAWRRSVLIVRGGAVATIDARLRLLGLPPVRTARAALASPRVAFMWAPQTAGTPDIPANAAAAYYPGGAYVDIVGTDFYSAFPNFAGLAHLYATYPSKPFGFNEWAMWRSGDPGFVRELFAFVRAHRRIALMLYNQGLTPGGPFRLEHFAAAAGELRRQLRSSRLLAYTPEWSAGAARSASRAR
jgi:hypothetical protein